MREPQLDGRASEPFYVAQKRICFTELTDRELPEHARRFGPFSVEFSIEALRRLGAIPVFYVPRGTTDNDLESVGNALLARMLEVEQLLARVAEMSAAVGAAASDNETMTVTVDGRAVGTLSMNVGQARELLALLLHGSQPAQQLLNAMRASASFFYPTEDLTFTDTLGYYRQREWRITSALVHRGIELSRPPAAEEIDQLVALDAEFFGTEVRFRTGLSTRARESRFMREVSGRHVLSFARRLFCPRDAVERASALLEKIPDHPEIVAV